VKAPVATPHAPQPTAGAPYSQAVIFGELVFVSGQLPLDATTGQLVSGGIEEQTHRVMKNLEAILAEAGAGLDKLLKTTVYLTDRAHWEPMNEVYREYVGDVPPARSAIAVGPLAFGALVEIDAIAHR
jgi:2-iminobutanoate/2-iminopropanoate deaminase